MGFSITGSHDSPSAAHVLVSAGADLDAPINRETGQPFGHDAGDIVLDVSVDFTFHGQLMTQGVVSSVLSSAAVKITIEEFSNATFAVFIGSRHSIQVVIRRLDFWYLSGNDAPILNGTVSIIFPPTVNPASAYRIWIDLEGEVASAGFGEPFQWGGSQASAAMGISFSNFIVNASLAH